MASLVNALTCCCPGLSQFSKRALIMIIVCIPLRTALACLGYAIFTNKVVTDSAAAWSLKMAWAAYCLMTSFNFALQAYRQCQGTKKTGGFGGPVFWKYSRYLHMILFFIEGIMFILKRSFAWAPLFLDVLVAVLTAFQQYVLGGPCSGLSSEEREQLEADKNASHSPLRD
eukprot:gb/GEZN01014519.1/.p1 GENE.gb/GEZN01014519.1/~~gb/GEZN01014519.1/.p1  ORF type:complete len:171 (+),score=10.73 gb/GEZN01014519.1/:25-537(+)